MTQRPRRTLIYGMNLVVMILALVAILGFINWLSSKHYKRWNLSESNTKALSDQTIRILKNLNKDISVTYFYKQTYEEGTEESRQAYKDLLERYHSLSPRFTYELIDYAKNPARAKLFLDNIKELNLEEGASVVKSGDFVQKINATTESALTQAIIKVTTGKERTVCFTTGHGEHDPDLSDTGGYSVTKKALESENFAVKKVSIMKDGIPDTCNVLVIAGALIPFQEAEAQRLKKWMDAGGNALFLTEPTGPTGLESILNEFGITAEDNVLKTDDAASMGIDPFEIYSDEYDPSHAITKSLSEMRVMFGESLRKLPLRMSEVRSLKVAEPAPTGVETTKLITSIDVVKAYPYTEAPVYKAMKRMPGASPAGEGKKPLTGSMSFLVAAAAKKVLKSETPEATPEAKLPDEKKAEKTTRIAVFGDSDWAADGFVDQMPNGDLFMNSIAWLAEEEQTAGIRAREKKFIPIQVAGSGAWLLLVGIVLVVPVVLIINAVMIWREKKRM